MTITKRDVKRLEEGQDMAQRIASEASALTDRLPWGSAAREKVKEASTKAAELDGALKAAREQIERTEDVRL